ncbi:uncharacterized protein LOC124446327 [Xenia sp. Carnegie-2017]|uniref:uncharacterized protein LOC124446327 n=1 Tax=Xenia sp. Carnegie-2017 TaxID=2897299 RepID=UPI001F03CD4E|nr:uncharacterized protein LOC124446327 [Xenia sp. Carnegie-2017]
MNTCDSDSPELTGSALIDNKVDPRPRYVQGSLSNVKNACVWPTVRRDSERLENKSKDKDFMVNNSSIRNYGKDFKTKTGKRSIAACFFGANAKNYGERNTETLAPGCAKSVESRGIKKSCDLHEILAFEPKNEIFSSKFAQLDLDFNAKKDRSLKVPEIESPSVRKMLDFYYLQDDTEIQKLKNELRDVNDAVEKMESTYKKIHLNKPKFRDIAPKERVIQLEREIRDAEILIQKKLEIWNAQSNEKELAFEKEMLHQNDDKSLLSQFSLEIKKDSLQNEISLRKSQLNVLQLKINQHNLDGNEG